MRRPVALLLLVVACSGGGGDGERAAPATSTSTTSTTTTATTAVPVVEVRTTARCRGIGPAPQGGEVTYVSTGALLARAPEPEAEERCLLEMRDPGVLEWGGNGDRLLAGRRTLVLADGTVRVVDAVDRVVGWSRPTGRAVLAVARGGGLEKRTLDGSAPIELEPAEEAVYHPAGEHVVSVVPVLGRPQLLLTDNVGLNPTWLSENEHAEVVRDLGFDARGRLLFVAEHHDGHHLHRYSLDSAELETLVAVPATEGLGGVAASPHDDAVAVARGACGADPLWVQRHGSRVETGPGEPVGWLPDGRLVSLVRPACGEPGDLFLYDLTIGSRRLLAGNVDAAAVRAPLPPPPTAPRSLVGAGFA